MVRSQLGKGWSIREQSGRVKVSLRWDDGTISTAGASSNGDASTDWQVVVQRFEKHKVSDAGATKPTTWARMYGPVMRQLLEVMAGSPRPCTGRDVLAGLRDRYGGEPGSQGRRLRMQYSTQLLRFAVQHCGAPARWLPPEDLGEFTGTKRTSQAASTPITDQQLVRLLEGIPDARWRLAVGLMACFGLRPVELRYCRPSADGKRLVVSYSKATAKGSTKPREVVGIDPVGLPGLAAQVLGQLTLIGKVPGATTLPPLGPRDGTTGQAVNVYLQRRKVWQALREQAASVGEELSSYAFRHGFALRAHEAAGLSTRVAAALMGHSLATHQKHYGRWTDNDTITAAMERAQERLNTLQAAVASPD
jgi:integrase